MSSASGTTFATLFQTTDTMVPMVLSDLSDEQARRRTRGDSGPSVAWTVGHLLACRDIMLSHCGVEPGGRWASFMSGEATDGSDYPTTSELKTAWAEGAEAFRATVSGLSEEQLSAELENGWHPGQTLREMIGFLTWHEAYHVGAIGQIRKGMGLPGPAELMMAARQAEAGDG